MPRSRRQLLLVNDQLASLRRYIEVRKEVDMDEPLDDSFTLSRVTLIAQASTLPVRCTKPGTVPHQFNILRQYQ